MRSGLKSADRPLYGWRSDPAVPPFADERAVIVFDGDCALCSGSVRFVARNDPSGRFRFVAAASELGQSIYAHLGLDPEDWDSFLLLQGGRAYTRSDASLRVLAGLRRPWPWAANVLSRAPESLRDRVYRLIARKRIHWFGRPTVCAMADPKLVGRVLA